MTVAYEKFLVDVLPYVRDCPQDVAVNAIRNAAIEFCDQSHWLTFEPYPQTILPNVNVYELDYDTGEEPVRLIWANINGFAARAHLNNDFDLVLQDTPTSTLVNGLTMEFAVRPTKTSLYCNDTLYTRWSEAISYGARRRLYDIPAQPFTDPERMVQMHMKFRAAIADARMERERELTIGPLQVQMRKFV